jgi:predicted DNA-binding protein (MmcQ/YjbR family)
MIAERSMAMRIVPSPGLAPRHWITMILDRIDPES